MFAYVKKKQYFCAQIAQVCALRARNNIVLTKKDYYD